MRKASKNLIALVVVLTIVLNIIIESFAQDPFTAVAVGGLSGASGAGLFGSMASASGIDIAWSNSGSDNMDAMWNVLNPDHVYFSGKKHEADPQTSPEDIYDYIQVDIGDWLSAQRDFIDEFVSNYNVSDNDSGNTDNVLELNGIPLNQSGSSYTSDVLSSYTAVYPNSFTLTGAGITITFTKSLLYASSFAVSWYYNGTNIRNYDGAYYNGKNLTLKIVCNIQPANVFGIVYADGRQDMIVDLGVLPSQSQTSWSSGDVNTGVFDGWESAKVKIPHNISQLSSGWTLTDFLGELNRIWSGAGEDNIIIENGSDDPPVPPQPIPDTPLGNVPFDDWVDLWGQGIYQQLENQSDALDFIGSNGEDAIEELESIDSNLGDILEDTGSIDTNIGIGTGLLGGIKSAVETGVDFLEGIAEHVEELVEEIVEGTETLIAGILNQIPSVFGVIFGPIKQASSIWHYVVEWIQSISAPMTWMWGIAGQTSYFIQLPIYASLAGAVVLAFYKRFGK